ncbi:hypothetical protein ACM66B_006269 [Microbotryomycetes sp. NB124-2]
MKSPAPLQDPPPRPTFLQRMIDLLDGRGTPDVRQYVHWTEDGTFVWVDDEADFERHVSRAVFGFKSNLSWYKQMNNWQFRRLGRRNIEERFGAETPTGTRVWYHSSLRRGATQDEIDSVRRHQDGHARKQRRAEAANERVATRRERDRSAVASSAASTSSSSTAATPVSPSTPAVADADLLLSFASEGLSRSEPELDLERQQWAPPLPPQSLSTLDGREAARSRLRLPPILPSSRPVVLPSLSSSSGHAPGAPLTFPSHDIVPSSSYTNASLSYSNTGSVAMYMSHVSRMQTPVATSRGTGGVVASSPQQRRHSEPNVSRWTQLSRQHAMQEHAMQDIEVDTVMAEPMQTQTSDDAGTVIASQGSGSGGGAASQESERWCPRAGLAQSSSVIVERERRINQTWSNSLERGPSELFPDDK